MNPTIESYSGFWEANRAVLNRYLTVFLLVTAGAVGYFLIEENYRYMMFAAIPAVFLLAISLPRLAVYQFIVALFSGALFSDKPVVLFVDLSAFVMACAALLDFLLRDSEVPKRLPKLTLNFLALIATLFICAVGAYNFGLVVKPLVRVVVMTVTFLSLYRLSRYFDVRHLVIVFFWVGVINALFVIKQVASGSEVDRVFGLAKKAQDDLMMILTPIGLLLYIWSRRYRGLVYLMGTGIIIGSLLASQTRFPIIFAAGISGLALVVSLVVARKRSGVRDLDSTSGGVSHRLVRLRVIVALGVSLISIGLAAALRPGLIYAVWARFELLISSGITGTAELRLVLWQTALRAFWDHPFLGIGPGNFDVVHSIYKQLHLNPAEIFVRGASAHNLFLQYLAEMGLLGGAVLVSLLANQFRLSYRSMRSQVLATRPEISLVLFVIAALFLGTTFVEAAWMWGQLSFVFVFFLALIARLHENVTA